MNLVGMKPPRLSESGFMRQVVELATILGWSTAHFRPAQTAKGWRTPVSGDLGKGWPDLTLVRGERIIFAELKRDNGKLTPDQERVLNVLGGTGAEVRVWFPADFDRIAEILR